jgi:uncharacterized protein YfaS (alpha-2-macroglobulin family)
MDLLRFLVTLPFRLVGWLLLLIALILRPIFGRVQWSAPGWLAASGTMARERPGRFAGIVAAILVLIAAAWGGWYWNKHRVRPPEPPRISMSARAPAPTTFETNEDGTSKITIHPLDVNFSGSAAPIELVGKPATAGIEMDPQVKGQWVWTTDKQLRFTPAQDWPVGAAISVKFDPAKAFAPQVLMRTTRVDVTMAPFTATLGSGQFYQDPQDATARKTIVPVTFNYPVDTARFEKNVALQLIGRDNKPAGPLKFSVTYDQFKTHAWIHSQPLVLPPDDSQVEIKIESGVTSSRGGTGTRNDLTARVGVPGKYSLAIQDISANLVDNADGEPDQVLIVNANEALRGEDLGRLIKAWVLPDRNAEDPNDDAGSDTPYDWQWDQVSEATLRASKALPLTLIPTETDYSQTESFKYKAEPGKRIYVRIGANLGAFGGYTLAKNTVKIVTVPEFPKVLKFMADGSLLSLSGSKRVSIVARNVPGIKLEIGRVLPTQIQNLINFNEGTYKKPSLSYGFNEDYIVERFEQKRSYDESEQAQPHYEGMDLASYLKSGKRGVFLLHASVYDADAEKKAAARAAGNSSGDAAQADAGNGSDQADDGGDSDDNGQAANADADSSDQADAGDSGDGDDASKPSDTRLIVVTDLGLLVKKAVDGAQDVFVQSIHTGAPVGGATVSVIAVNGTSLYSAATTADGVVHFPSFKGLERDKRPALYVVTKGDDMSFLPIGTSDRRLDYSRFDIGGDSNAVNAGQLSAYLFSDRGIYRPGELFHIGLIVRAANWANSPAGVPLQAEVVDPRGATVKQQRVTMDNSGFADLDYTPADTAPTGTWTVNLYTVKDGKSDTQIGTTTVKVKEFMPDSMKVKATLSKTVAEGWIKPDGLQASVDAENLFGTPAADRKVTATLTLRPAFPGFKKWPGYHFYDARRATDGYEEQLPEGKTDDKGQAQFDLNLQKYADATYQLYFVAQAFEAGGGRSVAAAAQSLVSNNDWLVGYKAVDDLGYITRGTPRTVKLVAVDPQVAAIEVGGLKAQLIERKYVSVLTKDDSGAYRYVSKLKEAPVSEQPLTIPAAGMDYALPTDRLGNFALLIRRADNTVVNRIDYSVAGQANISRTLDRNAELQINLNKTSYAPGESVEVAIRAPYAGSGLITIERDKVYAYAWFHATTSSSVQHITVPADFEGNGYINVQYIRDPSSDEIFMSPLSYGVMPFTVNLDARRNNLTLDAPDLIKPGQAATFTLHAAQPTRAVIFAVDEGILQVAHYKLGDPLAFFFRKKMLQVGTSQILDLILPDFEKLMALAAAPGGDGDDPIGRQLNPFKRKHAAPAVYWSGIVDVNGTKSVQYTVPDYFNGRLRVMAVAVAPERIGIAETQTTVRGDFVLSPNVPTTLAPGDESDLSVGVANNLTHLDGKTVPIEVTLKTGAGLQVEGNATQSIELGELREGTVHFKVKATDTLGSANMDFTASYAQSSARQSLDLSVRPASPYRTQVDMGRVDANGKQELQNLRNMFPQYAARDAAISTVPAVFTQALSKWLEDVKNYCSEQLASQVVPRLIQATPTLTVRPGAPQAIRGGASAPDDAKALARLLDVLHTRQNGEGGFGVWVATPGADPFVSAYAMHVMLEARDRGITVPQDMIDAGNRYLRKLAADQGLTSLQDLRQRAYAVYLLTRQGNVTTNNLAAVQQRLQEAYPNVWKNDLAAGWLAAAYKLQKQDKEADGLIEGPQKLLERDRDTEPYAYSYYYDALTRDSSVLYLLAKYFPERTRSLSPRVMENIARPLGGQLFNTLSAAMTELALDAYARQTATDLDKLDIAAVGADGNAVSIVTSRDRMVRASNWAATVRTLRFSDNAGRIAWYAATQAGYDRDPPKDAIRNGLEIIREYTDADGKPLNGVKLGQEIEVHLKIRATGNQGVGNIAIVDLLPGGFDPVLEPPPAPPPQDASAGSDAADANSGGSGGSDASNGTGDTDDAQPAWRSPIGLGKSTWKPEYADVREDRVVIYGEASPNVQEFIYRIKASNAGTYIVPPAYGESMYDRRVQARSAGGGTLTVAQ